MKIFKNVEARFALRCLLFGAAAAVAGAQAGANWTAALLAGATGALAYAGIGAAVPAVEPSIGKKLGP